MNKKLLKSMLVVACAIMGGQNVWADETTVELPITGHVAIVGTDMYANFDASLLYLNSYAPKGGADAISFQLDNNFSAEKVKSAVLKLYVTSKPNKNRSGNINFYGLTEFPSPSTDVTTSNDGKTKIYQYGGPKIKRYTFTGSTAFKTISHNCYTNNYLKQGTYNDVDITDYIQTLTSTKAGDDIYIGMDISDFAADTYIAGYGHENAAKLVITYTSEEQIDYTINYKYNGNIVSTTTDKAISGTSVSAKDVVYDEQGQRYLTSAETTPSLTVSADNNTLDVDVRKPYSATLNLVKVVNGKSTTTSSVFEEADDKTTSWSYSYPMYELAENGKYYGCNASSFTKTGTFTNGETIDETITYDKLAKDILYFSEAENLNDNIGASKNANLSNGAYSAIKGGKTSSLGSLSAGTYSVTAYLVANGGRGIYVRDTKNTDYTTNTLINLDINKNSKAGLYSKEFTLDNETTIGVTGWGTTASTNQSADFDYVYIKAISIPASVSAAQYATFIPSYNIVAQSDVKAYTVKVNTEKKGIELNAIAEGTVIPAGTPLLLNAAEATYNFAVSTNDAAEITNNDLVAATTDVIATGNEYALTKKNGVVGFAPVQADVVIPAGKAYLQVAGEGAKFFSLDGEATGINNIGTANNAADAYYTLQGVKTLKPAAKGVYILNGKKVVVNK